MTASLNAISSMAMRQVLAEIASACEQGGGVNLRVESVGGVDAAGRVQAGEAFDAVFLAADAIDKLVASGSVVRGSRVDLVLSGVSIAVREGAPRPDIASEEAVKQAVLAAPTIGYSTGPSGIALLNLFDRWGITPQLQGRLKQAAAGIPVGSMVAKGEVALGFQQLSELMNLPGITVVGPMPEPIRIDTIFSGAVCTASAQPEAVRSLLALMASPEVAVIIRRNGMAPA